MGILELSAKDLIIAGGPIMIPIVLCSIFAIAIIAERINYLSKFSQNTAKLKKDIFHLVGKNKLQEAINICEKSDSPLAGILKSGILKYGSSRSTVKEAMENSSNFEIPKLSERLAALATLAHAAPLIGLLGTILGMAVTFFTFESRAQMMLPVTMAELSRGMWQALITTLAGLIVAVPAFMAHNYFVDRINYLTLEMERGADELLELISQMTEGSQPPGYEP